MRASLALLPLLAACSQDFNQQQPLLFAAEKNALYFEDCLLDEVGGDTLYRFRYYLDSMSYTYQCDPRLRFDFSFRTAGGSDGNSAYSVLYGGPAATPRDTLSDRRPGTSFGFRNTTHQAGKARTEYTFGFLASGKDRFWMPAGGPAQVIGPVSDILARAARAGGLGGHTLRFRSVLVDDRHVSLSETRLPL